MLCQLSYRGLAGAIVARCPSGWQSRRVAGRPGGRPDAGVVLAVRVREQPARSPEGLLDLLARAPQLPFQLAVRELHEMRVAPRVRADLDSFRQVSQVGPGQRGQLD